MEINTALWSRTLRGIKDNFHTQYSENLNGNLCETNTDKQERCMNCPKILNRIIVEKEHRYCHIFGTTMPSIILNFLSAEKYCCWKKRLPTKIRGGGGLAGFFGHFSDLRYWHATTKTYAYFWVFGFF